MRCRAQGSVVSDPLSYSTVTQPYPAKLTTIPGLMVVPSSVWALFLLSTVPICGASRIVMALAVVNHSPPPPGNSNPPSQQTGTGSPPLDGSLLQLQVIIAAAAKTENHTESSHVV